jgi:hypothetical protein
MLSAGQIQLFGWEVFLLDVVDRNRILGEKPGEVRQPMRCNGRFKKHAEADVMFMECGV